MRCQMFAQDKYNTVHNLQEGKESGTTQPHNKYWP